MTILTDRLFLKILKESSIDLLYKIFQLSYHSNELCNTNSLWKNYFIEVQQHLKNKSLVLPIEFNENVFQNYVKYLLSDGIHIIKWDLMIRKTCDIRRKVLSSPEEIDSNNLSIHESNDSILIMKTTFSSGSIHLLTNKNEMKEILHWKNLNASKFKIHNQCILMPHTFGWKIYLWNKMEYLFLPLLECDTIIDFVSDSSEELFLFTTIGQLIIFDRKISKFYTFDIECSRWNKMIVSFKNPSSAHLSGIENIIFFDKKHYSDQIWILDDFQEHSFKKTTIQSENSVHFIFPLFKRKQIWICYDNETYQLYSLELKRMISQGTQTIKNITFYGLEKFEKIVIESNSGKEQKEKNKPSNEIYVADINQEGELKICGTIAKTSISNTKIYPLSDGIVLVENDSNNDLNDLKIDVNNDLNDLKNNSTHIRYIQYSLHSMQHNTRLEENKF